MVIELIEESFMWAGISSRKYLKYSYGLRVDALAVSASENRMGLFLLIDCINQDSVSGYYEIPNLAFGFRIIQGYIGGR